MERERSLMVAETAGSVMWFAMDACWMIGSEVAASALAIPTIALNVVAFRYLPHTAPAFLVAGAMTAWASMNVFWMLHEFRFVAWGLIASKAFLALGVLLLALALLVSRSGAFAVLAERFRRLRLRG